MAKSPEGEQPAEKQAEANTELPPSVGSAPVAPDVQPGAKLLNPSQPLAPTIVPPPADVSKFLAEGQAASGFPKKLYHPVHGEIEVKDPNEEAKLQTRRDWFDTPELADAARTATEAWMAHQNNLQAKLRGHQEAGQAVVRNSNQADQSIRSGQPEPL
jgi:hypothetical protein